MSNEAAFPAELEVIVEVARWGLIKRGDDGRIDLVSPLPCPFNYGSVPGTRAADGEREDALLLGPRVAIGSRLRVPVLGRVRFVDAGQPDDKWLCGIAPLRTADRLSVRLFFEVYARMKRTGNKLRGRDGQTFYGGLELPPS